VETNPAIGWCVFADRFNLVAKSGRTLLEKLPVDYVKLDPIFRMLATRLQTAGVTGTGAGFGGQQITYGGKQYRKSGGITSLRHVEWIMRSFFLQAPHTEMSYDFAGNS